MLKYWFWNF